jgi:hypothetical protein
MAGVPWPRLNASIKRLKATWPLDIQQKERTQPSGWIFRAAVRRPRAKAMFEALTYAPWFRVRCGCGNRSPSTQPVLRSRSISSARARIHAPYSG